MCKMTLASVFRARSKQARSFKKYGGSGARRQPFRAKQVQSRKNKCCSFILKEKAGGKVLTQLANVLLLLTKILCFQNAVLYHPRSMAWMRVSSLASVSASPSRSDWKHEFLLLRPPRQLSLQAPGTQCVRNAGGCLRSILSSKRLAVEG